MNHCCGYVEGQLKSINEKTPTDQLFKLLYHALRLLCEAERALSEHRIDVTLKRGERDILLAVRRGEHSKEAVLEMIDAKKKSLQSLRKSSKLGKKLEKNTLADWIVKIRKGEL